MVTTVVLICAVLSSLTAGVLLAYAVCDLMFRMFQMHSTQVAQQRAARKAVQELTSVGLVAN